MNIVVERKLTTLEKQLINEYKKGHYMLFWVGKYKRRFSFNRKGKKETLLWFANYFEFGGKENE